MSFDARDAQDAVTPLSKVPQQTSLTIDKRATERWRAGKAGTMGTEQEHTAKALDMALARSRSSTARARSCAWARRRR